MSEMSLSRGRMNRFIDASQDTWFREAAQSPFERLLDVEGGNVDLSLLMQSARHQLCT